MMIWVNNEWVKVELNGNLIIVMFRVLINICMNNIWDN